MLLNASSSFRSPLQLLHHHHRQLLQEGGANKASLHTGDQEARAVGSHILVGSMNQHHLFDGIPQPLDSCFRIPKKVQSFRQSMSNEASFWGVERFRCRGLLIPGTLLESRVFVGGCGFLFFITESYRVLISFLLKACLKLISWFGFHDDAMCNREHNAITLASMNLYKLPCLN